MTFTVTDGGLGDDDLTADGVLTDPGAPGNPENLDISNIPVNGQVGSPYNTNLTGVGGTGPYTRDLHQGSLPTGLNLESGSGNLGGTPTQAGVFDFTVELVDTGSHDDATSKFFRIVITDGANPIGDLISYYYQSVLGRIPEPGGLSYYQDRITKAQTEGRDVKPEFRDMAFAFLNSPEYLIRGTSHADYVNTLYQTFLQRGPEDAGLVYYLDRLKKGEARNILIDNFTHSPEFAQFMANLGL
ncbi:hypothetical protein CCP4SC76_6550007 [Gammaproteobacteria bacterium]